jgi:hypothetical protein
MAVNGTAIGGVTDKAAILGRWPLIMGRAGQDATGRPGAQQAPPGRVRAQETQACHQA